VQIPDYWQ